MFKELTEEEFLRSAKPGERVAVYEEVAADTLTPITAFSALEGSVLLESAEGERRSFLGLHCIASFTAIGSDFTIIKEGEEEKGRGDPFARLFALQQELRCTPIAHMPPLAGGAIGFLTYEAVRLLENLPAKHVPQPLPDLFFQFFKTLLIFDHVQGKMTFSVVVKVSTSPQQDFAKAKLVIAELKQKLKSPSTLPVKQSRVPGTIEDDMSDAAFAELVKEGKKHIVAGDVFQLVLSRTFRRAVVTEPFAVYRALRLINPSPFMFFIQEKDFALVGASPERLVRVEKGIVETVPIAGTRRHTKGEDTTALEQELLSDEKETAEHMMLVDLARNDIGKIAKIGSVQVPELKQIHKFSHVIHLVSKVTGQLEDSYTPLDALQAVFPAGTLTGAPKVRAMQLIDAMEKSARGLYGGAICTLDSLGNLDSCIAIRFAHIKEGVAEVRTGAGIVFDSDPEKETQETRDKAAAVLEAIRYAEKI